MALLEITDLRTQIQLKNGVVHAVDGVTLHVDEGETLSLRNREYVQAVKVIGGRPLRSVLKHIVPNAIGTIIVQATFAVADAIITLSILGFLTLGVAPPNTDWGSMLSGGLQYIQGGNYWWLIYPPGVLIILTCISFNFIGDALRDAFETRLQRR